MCIRIFIFQIFLIFPFAISANSETVEVEIFKSAFFPAVVEVKKGDTVKWVNKEEVLHTVTSGKSPIHDDKFNASFLVKEYEVKIDETPGVIDYFCAIHNATMRGAIIVVEKK
ncbi:MAG: plastocyanin/azurin family copper-binding protein [Nitrospinota bacterium]